MLFRNILNLVVFCLCTTLYAQNNITTVPLVKTLTEFNSCRTIDLTEKFIIEHENKHETKFSSLQNYSVEKFTLTTFFQPDSFIKNNSSFLAIDGINGIGSVFVNDQLLSDIEQTVMPALIKLPAKLLLTEKFLTITIDINRKSDLKTTLPLLVKNQGLPVSLAEVVRSVRIVSVAKPFLRKITISGAGGEQFKNLTYIYEADPNQLSDCRLLLIDQNSDKTKWKSPATVGVKSDHLVQYTFQIPDNEVTFWSPENPATNKFRLEDAGNIMQSNELSIAIAKEEPVQNAPLKTIEWVYSKNFQTMPSDSLKEKIYDDLLEIKNTGANAVRLISMTPPLNFLDVCDEIGLHVLVDLPINNIPPAFFKNENYRKKLSRTVEHFISTFDHHPSIIAWGLGTGFSLKDKTTYSFLTDLCSTVKSVTSRPVYACHRDEITETVPLIDWMIKDFVIYNNTQIPSFLPDINSTKTIYRFQVPVCSHAEKQIDMEKQQALIYQNIFSNFNKKSDTDIIAAALQDWQGDTPLTFSCSQTNTRMSMTGIKDQNNNKRPSYDVIKAAFKGLPKPDLIAPESKLNGTNAFIIIGFAVIFLFLLYLKNDKRLQKYLRRIFLFPHGFYTDLIENRHILHFPVAATGVVAFTSLTLIFTGIIYHFRNTMLFDEILTWLFSTPQAKGKIIYIIQHPSIAVVVSIAGFFIILIIQAFIFKVFIFFQKRFLKLPKIISFLFGVPANLVLLLPVALVFDRILSKTAFIIPAYFLVLLFIIWFLVRVFRGLEVILQLSTFKTLLFCLVQFLFVILCIGLYFHLTKSILYYAPYYFSLLF